MSFSNSDFLQLSYSFEPIDCPGHQSMSFVVPPGVPNGEASVTWQCSGQTPHCFLATVFGGLADPAMNLQLPGTVGCVLKAVQTSTSIVTTTSSASTLTTTLTRTLTTTSTSYSFDRTIQSTSSRADQPSSTTLTPQPTSITSPEAAMGQGQVAVSTAQSPTPASKLATSSGPPSVMTGSGTFGTSIGTTTTGTGTGTISTRTDISSMIPYTKQRTSTLSTSSDAPPTSVTSTATEVKGAASLFEVSRGTRISTNMAAISVFTTLTIIHTAQSCTIGV
ncbi:hypothetical protein PG991_015827 [Apiospora marii]|uniref:Uncharacterized protein n=1 Tax=Apiospora marii TaxID=335849 RepID=A0ABR1QZS2_9PEZI